MGTPNYKNRHRDLGHYIPVVNEDGLMTNSPVNIGWKASHQTSAPQTGATLFVGGGVIQSLANDSTVFHTGGYCPAGALTTNYHQTQVVSTDTYFAEVFLPANAKITGISVLNGATTSASQNTFVGLANSQGTIVANSATTTAQGAANAYQQIPFTSPYQALGPGKYYICVQGSNTTGYFGTHSIGNFGAALKTSETYGTFVTSASYSTTTFTASQGPIADTY